MKNYRLHWVSASLAAALSAVVVAMPGVATGADNAASAPAALPAASAPSKPEKRPATPEEKRDSATAPGELRTEVRATPQLNIPLKSSGAGKPTYVRPPRGKAAPSGGIDDSAARCNAMADAKAQQECRDKLP